MPEIAHCYAADVIDEYLHSNTGVTGICSLAAGSDQLFARKIIESGNGLSVVVPCKGYETTFEADGREEYRQLLAAAAHTETLDFDAPSEQAFFAAGKKVVEDCDELIAVWDGEVARGLGGTADVIGYARELGKRVLVLWPEGVSRQGIWL
jgi:hypothetical protein